MDRPLALALLAAAGGPVAPRRRLLATTGDAVHAVRDRGAWQDCGLTPAQTAILHRPPGELLGHLADWLGAPGHAVIACTDPDFPPALAAAASPPLALFVAGDSTLLWRPSVAVVGSRGATPGGRQHAAEFAQAFARAGLVVGSGMAAGIDAAAHAAVLASDGATFAVLGTGPDVAYPPSHAALHRELAARGALVSEHAPGVGPRREHFPSRNRLLAALCLGTVVIEAAQRSGALITARLAAEAGREVFALPGSVRNPLTRGCHRLIRDGATLVESPAEVIEALSTAALREVDRARSQLGLPLAAGPPTGANASPAPDADHDILWRALGFDPTDMDELAERTGLTLPELSPMLLAMELDGRVARQHGRYVRLG
jgi:DNA processing protein